MMQCWRIGLFFLLFSTAQLLHATLNIAIESPSALLINAANGKVLFAKNASQSMYPASCTKIAFALYAIKYHQDLFPKKLICSQNAVKAMPESQKSKNNFASVPSYVLETDASHMGLKVDEEMSFYDLLEATMVISGDDASNMIAEAMGNGSIEKCVEEVNRYILSLGCKNTHFTNPHGLHHPNHVSTAEDLALLCQEAMKEPLFRNMVKMSRYLRPGTNKQDPVFLRATNRLLVQGPSYYPPALGIKTGYHRRAGCCLAAQAEKNERSLISVILQAKTSADRFQDTQKLFEAAFQETKVRNTFFEPGPQSFSRKIEKGDVVLKTYTQEPLMITYYPSEKPEISCQLIWNKVPLPIKKGTVVGTLVLYADHEVVQQAKLYAINDVRATFFHTLKQLLNPMILMGLTGLVGLLILVIRKGRVMQR